MRVIEKIFMVCGFIVRLASCEKVLIELNCDILHSSEVAGLDEF